jgi:hypothetical protein
MVMSEESKILSPHASLQLSDVQSAKVGSPAKRFSATDFSNGVGAVGTGWK